MAEGFSVRFLVWMIRVVSHRWFPVGLWAVSIGCAAYAKFGPLGEGDTVGAIGPIYASLVFLACGYVAAYARQDLIRRRDQ